MSVLINAVLFGKAGSLGESGPEAELNFLEAPKSHLLALLWQTTHARDASKSIFGCAGTAAVEVPFRPARASLTDDTPLMYGLADAEARLGDAALDGYAIENNS
jgi:hypothetical protein